MKITRRRGAATMESIGRGDGREEQRSIRSSKAGEEKEIMGLHLRVCAEGKDLERGVSLHDEISKRGMLRKNPDLGGVLIHMYARCEELEAARSVLDELLVRTAIAWNVMISGYIRGGQAHEALHCFHRMQSEGIAPSAITYACILNSAELCLGEQVHANVASSGLLRKDVVLGNALIGMYAKCGTIDKARRALEELPLRDVVSWSSLITGYARQGRADEASDCFERMQNEAICPDGVALICMLKACCSGRSIDRGERVHNRALSWGGSAEKDSIELGATLVDMYAKCGALAKARQVLDELRTRDVVCWNALIAGCAHHGRCEEAWRCFEQMQHEGLCPDPVTFICISKACGNGGAIDKGKRIHSKVSGAGLLEKDIALGNSLVDMYAKCGVLERAEEVLEGLPARDEVSWNTIIAGYSRWRRYRRSLECFAEMRREGISPGFVTFVSVLQACGGAGAIAEGEQAHEEILLSSRSSLEKHAVLGNALVDMYGRCGMLAKARGALEEIPRRDVASWNALIAAYAQQGQCEEAFGCLESMRSEHIAPDPRTYMGIVKACGRARAKTKGQRIHESLASKGWLNNDAMLGNALVDMHARCGELGRAQRALEELLLPRRDVVAWNALIAGFVRWGRCRDALECFDRMQEEESISPSHVTYICVLKACGGADARAEGERVHRELAGKEMLRVVAALGNALVGMYAECGRFGKAIQALEGLGCHDAISWNALIARYIDRGRCREAMRCFDEMQHRGVPPDGTTFLCVLKACGSLACIEAGRRVHRLIAANRGLLETDAALGIALVDMYAKCGSLGRAWDALEGIGVRSAIAWNALIAGYALQGRGVEALACLQLLLCEGVPPDAVTMLCVLAACSRSGLVDQSQKLLASMARSYGIAPDEGHLTCLVAALGHSGLLRKAVSAAIDAMTMPSPDYPPLWLALLASCRKWGDAELSGLAFDRLSALEFDRCAPLLMPS